LKIRHRFRQGNISFAEYWGFCYSYIKTLRGGDVLLKVYTIHLDRDLTEAEYQSLLPCISEERRERIARFHNYSDKQRALLGEILARRAIAERLGLMPDEIDIIPDQYGKPLLPAYPQLHFNISHSGEYVVCAICGSPVGIDVELRQHRGFLEIAQRFFHTEENEYIRSFGNKDERVIAFANIWTMKEAYIKRDGRGLTIPLPSFSVLSLQNVTFHKALDASEAVCHVCVGADEKTENIQIISSNL
jgi:4'-phosphopantetheinyl transferase